MTAPHGPRTAEDGTIIVPNDDDDDDEYDGRMARHPDDACGDESPKTIATTATMTPTSAAADDDDEYDGRFDSDDDDDDNDNDDDDDDVNEDDGDGGHEDDDDDDKEGSDDPKIVEEDMNAMDLLAASKLRLRTTMLRSKTTKHETEDAAMDDDEGGVDDDDDDDDGKEVEKTNEGVGDTTERGKGGTTTSGTSSTNTNATTTRLDQAHYVELALARRKLEDAERKARNDDDDDDNNNDPVRHTKLAERKAREAQARALTDEMSAATTTGGGVNKGTDVVATTMPPPPATPTATTNLPPKPARSDNSELWALLNYSKMRLETGSTPQVGGGKRGGGGGGGGGGGSKNGSIVRGGDDALSVSSKLSKSSKSSRLSMGSSSRNNANHNGAGSNDNDAPFAVVGCPRGAEDAVDADAPPWDVNDAGDASVDGSVSLESATKNDIDVSRRDSDDDDDDDEEEEEEEEELPDFLKDNDDEDVDPEEARALYEAAKFKAASILSVTKDNLSDVQMLQAIAIAEEAAKKGEDKFSTKRSLFKLNEAKVEDLKAFLNFSSGPTVSEGGTDTTRDETARDVVGWGIGRGRLLKKLGAVARDFKDKCSEIDERTQRERIGQPTGKDLINAAMLDLKVQIEEYEKIMMGTVKKEP